MNTAEQIAHDPVAAFVKGWGKMGMYWGVGKVMAEIHALLYLSTRPLSLEEMSERLKTSRSNISLNVRALQDLGVVHKSIVPGDRKDYYTAEEDVVKVARRLAAKKKKRELDPAINIVEQVLSVSSDHESIHGDVDTRKLEELKRLMEAIETMFDAFIGEDSGDGAAKTRHP